MDEVHSRTFAGHLKAFCEVQARDVKQESSD